MPTEPPADAEPEAAPDDDLAADVAALRAPAQRRLVHGLAVGALVAIALPIWASYGEDVRSYVRGEVDLEGEPRFEPAHEPDAHALARIDFGRVHRELYPAWTLAMARSHGGSAYWEREADERFEALVHEIAPDPNLSQLLTATQRDLAGDPLERARRLDYRLWAYNEYLDQQRIPWRLEVSLAINSRRTLFRALSYEVMADAATEQGHRVRLLRRADRINSREGWLGRTGRSEDGAMVLMRRVLHFTVRHVWTALHPALDSRRPAAERPWLGYVRDEVAHLLPEETFRLLAETAVDQQALIEVATEIDARRECGSRFRVVGLPYNGLSPENVEALEEAVERSRGNSVCPDITLDEAAVLVGASERLGHTDGIEEAVERLAMLVARAVAVHELRHVADGDELACPGCPEGLDGVARDEVSAYLTAFADPGTGYLSLLQACSTPRSRTIHGAALTAVLEALLPFGCEGPTLHGLAFLSREIEVELFGEREPIAVPSLPERVMLLPRPARAERHVAPGEALEGGWGMAVSPP